MNLPREDEMSSRVRNAEETLRLIARVPAPEGLAERVQICLRSAPRSSFLTRWRGFGLDGWMYSPALRGAAAAGIVMMVAGGGWRIYSHVQPAPTAKAIVMPARVGNGGAFSNAGAMRTPNTLEGPVLARPVAPDGAKDVKTIVPVKKVTPQKPRTAGHKKASGVISK